MICQKCHSPYNEGDKFCQVCGATLEANNEPKNEGTVSPQTMAPVQETNNQPMNNMNQPVGQVMPQNQTNYQQPMNSNLNNMNNNMTGNMNMGNNQPMGNIPGEPKKNNAVVFILVGVIVILIAVVVFLVVSKGDDTADKDKKDDKEVVEKDDDKDEPSKEVVSSQYNKTEVMGYTFYLPEGYNAGYYEDVVFYDDDMYVQGYVSSGAGMISTIDKDGTKANFEQLGITNITYTTLTENGKNMVVFTGNYNGYVVEIIYVEYTKTEFVAAEVYYVPGKDSSETKKDVYGIMARVEADDTSYSTTTNVRVPNLKLEVK
ncbi:MAG: zinc ribbon domain-containing protein [Bacilli bacterium]|nr:zinc ribbon domain-containing protein [Bacilli bacterium]